MRVIGGTWGGRRLLGPPRGAETRPTSDRVREAIFNIAASRLDGARVLDLFAGTGALGVEALSRGAAHATFVECDRGLCQTIETNLEGLECEASRYTVLLRDVRRAFKQAAGPFDLVFIDPPYGHRLEREALAALAAPGLLAPDALVVVEHASRETLDLPPALADAFDEPDTRAYGDTSVTLYRPKPAAPAVAPEPDAPESAVEPAQKPVGRVAVYAGSFDPPTNGHIDIIRRAATICDRLVVAVAGNPRKSALFTSDERVEMLREILVDEPRVEVDRIDGLLVDYARQRGATVIIRGLRAVADFEYEFQMACMNHHLAPGVETVFLMTAQEYFYVSSSLVKEVASFGGDVTPFLPPTVRSRLLERIPLRRG
jgi:pantetheine-phosphate adenylyltransferase